MKNPKKLELLEQLHEALKALKQAKKLAGTHLGELLDDAQAVVEEAQAEARKLPVDEESPNKCKNLRLDDFTCRTGCPKIQVAKASGCPFDIDEDARDDCPCYRK